MIDAARKASNAFRLPVDVIDSRACSIGQGWQVLKAAQPIEEESDQQRVLHRVHQVC
jgi:fatty acid-binding protein DegV